MQARTYKTFKALGILLCYPEREWLEGASDLAALIAQEGLAGKNDIEALNAFTTQLQAQDIFEIQEAYVDAFDRVRSLSLHLFEHVHGESRDRGQAMVDLAERYAEQGMTLAASELPDYLPVFLEYLSLLPREEALEELAETGHILAALSKRLAERGSAYSAVFDCLTRLSGRKPEKVERRPAPAPDFAQMDKEWEEKPVDFLGAEAPQAGGCGSGGCGGCGGGNSAKATDGAPL
ncbi:MAG: nitrate reductase molybdenum cofactor assembly chaperone [Alphaproteobacteria bacterium]|nr:nitrate reductase molybdenum cofactor assembly chaperone [Alphaproteobacteria bacterium]